jgi:hypothetical protein
MADSFIQALMNHLHAQDSFPIGVKVLLVLDNGVTLRGQIVSPAQFKLINTDPTGNVADRAQMIDDLVLRRNQVDGSWPPGFDFQYSDDEPASSYVHLVDVDIFADGWIPSSTAAVPTKNVIACGDQWH